jgi:tetratricopeptide (TPR) repeat protein
MAGAAEGLPRRESFSPDAAVFLRRGLEYVERPRPEDQAHAATLLGKALALEPELPEAHAGLARISTYLYTLGLDETKARLDDALDAAGRAVAMTPDEGRFRATLALALAAADRLTPALEEARQGVELAPEAAGAHLALSVVLRLRGEHQEAVTVARRAAGIDPWSPRVLGALAAALREAKQYASAIELYGQAVDLDPESIALQFGAAAALQQASRSGTAGRLYAVLRHEWDYAERRIRQGQAAISLKTRDYSGALATYADLELLPNGNLSTLLMLYGKGYCLLQLDRPAEAEYFLSTLIERVPHDYDGPIRGREFMFRAYDDLAQYFEDRGRHGRAEELLQEASSRPYAPSRLALRLADLLDGTDRIGEAAETLERTIMNGDPGEDALDLAAATLRLIRIRTRGGDRSLARQAPATRALQVAAERIASSHLGAAHYRLARAQALTGDAGQAAASLALGHEHGYLPIELMKTEPDFDPIRDDPRFQQILER